MSPNEHFAYDFDNQQAFDYVVEFMHKQGSPAMVVLGCCKYRTQDDKKCAAGCLLPDEAIKDQVDEPKWMTLPHAFEGQTVGKVVCETYLPKVEFVLIREMQSAHDGASLTDFKSAFVTNMKDVASRYKLNASKLELFND